MEFKAGAHGLEAPQNVGIYLERVKRKGDFFIVLFTAKGRREFRRDRVGRVLLSSKLPEDVLADDEALRGRLGALVEEAASGAPEASRRIAQEGQDRDLWRRLDGAGVPLSIPQIASAVFGAASPKEHQLSAVRDILRSCERPGVGYFERVPGREERWRPLARDEYQRIAKEREGLNALRNRLVRSVEVEDGDRVRTAYVGVPLAEANLGDEDRACLEFVRDVMAEFVHHDRLPPGRGVAGTGVHTIDAWKLLDHLRFLAFDWTGSRASVSSTFIEFLLGLRLWNEQDALTAVARRHVAASEGFEWAMDERAVQEASRFPAEIPADVVAVRVDLRGTECYTIDPADAKDHDDAVGVDRLADGGWRLRVHIADVAHYVRPGSPLDRMARGRATSLYLPTGVLPMLPPRLSEDLCSLRADRDRLAMTAELEYDATGRLRSENFLETVIRVRGNVTYPEVDAALEQARDPFAPMGELARLLQAQRRGLALETGEVRVVLAPEAVTSHVKFGTPATRMIEAFMVAANEAVARHLARGGVPALYRCHPLPDRAAVARFNAQMRTLELPAGIELPEPTEDEKEPEGPSVLDLLKGGKSLTLVGGGFRVESDEAAAAADEEPNGEGPAAPPALVGLAQLTEGEQEAWLAPFRRILETVNALSNLDLREIAHVKLLSCLGRALYTPDNLGHFGLGSTCYCHFTSPIRRYPDLVVHRQLRTLLRGEAAPHERDELVSMAAHCSEQGGLADDLERAVVQVALLLQERASSRTWPRPGLVNGLSRRGIFVSLGEGLEARVLPSDLPGGPWSVDENESYLFVGSRDRPELAGQVTGTNWRELFDETLGEVVSVRLRLGDRILVTKTGFDYVEGKIAAKVAEG